MTSRPSIILERGLAVASPALGVYSVFLLFSGHNRPGGGFAGGLVAGVVIVLGWLADRRAPSIDGSALMGWGLAIGAISGFVSMAVGGTFLEAGVASFQLPVFGSVKVPSVLAFDIGVFLVVVGMVRTIVDALSEEPA